MNIQLLHVYGFYFSNIIGNVVLADPLLPPKKCPLDCISCPLGVTKRFEREVEQRVDVNSIISELQEIVEVFKQIFLNIDAIYMWGFGDPLVLSNLNSVVKAVSQFVNDRGLKTKILLHASSVNIGRLVKHREILDYVDDVIIPYMWYGEDKVSLGWNLEHNFNLFLEMMKSVNMLNKNKITVELHVFRIGDLIYPDQHHLAETIAHLRNTKIENIVIKRVDRPSEGHVLKPAPEGYVNRVKEELINSGFRVSVDVFTPIKRRIAWRNTITALYNYIVRIPLKYSEIKEMYGDLGVEALNNLIAKNLAVRRAWSGNIYFKGLVAR